MNKPTSKIKTLKLAFAMGGGVSLGTFSGAALTECIKQLIIQGGIHDKNGDWFSFENIELDVFSGASAGAISLAIMLRMLIAYEDKIHFLADLDRYNDLKGAAPEEFKNRIRENLADEIKGRNLSEDKIEQLIGVQVAQDFEELLWCHKVDLNELARVKNTKSMVHTGGILDTGYLRQIAKETIWPDQKIPVIKNEHTILNNRVLFVNSLTRIKSQKIDALPEKKDIKSFFHHEGSESFYQDLMLETLVQGMSSETHKDLRIFDIDLRPGTDTISQENNFPNRWVYSYNQDALSEDDRLIRDKNNIDPDKEHLAVNDLKLWKMISNTCLAAGAFPIAFEPVRLRRYKNETQNKDDEDFYYIDGGTLNNEPIREAFRLSGFLDNLDDRPTKEYKRMIIYVDPFVSEKPAFEAHDFFGNKNMYGGEKISEIISPLLTILRHEGSIVEMDKTIGVLDKFEGLNFLKQIFSQTVQKGLQTSGFSIDETIAIRTELNALVKFVKEKLNKNQDEISIPAISLNFQHAIRNVIINKENDNRFTNQNLIKGLKNIHFLKDENNDITKSYLQFFESKSNNDPISILYFQDWLTALFFVGLEITMDLSGKDQNSFILPIGPISIDKERKIKPIKLEGMPLEGFMGFVDKKLRFYDFMVGKIVAKNILGALNLIEDNTITEVLKPKEWDVELISNKLHSVIKKRMKTDKLLYNYLSKKTNRILNAAGNWYIRVFQIRSKKIKNWVDKIHKEHRKSN